MKTNEKQVPQESPGINEVPESVRLGYGRNTQRYIRKEDPAVRVPSNDIPEKSAGSESETYGRCPGCPGKRSRDNVADQDCSRGKGDESNELRENNRAIRAGRLGTYPGV